MKIGDALARELTPLKKEFEAIGERLYGYNNDEYTSIADFKEKETARLKQLKKEKGIED